MPLRPVMCTGFEARSGNARQLRNGSDTVAVYSEIGDRTAGDDVTYPDDDIKIVVVASDLTLIECDRVLLRAMALKELTEAEAADRRAHLLQKFA